MKIQSLPNNFKQFRYFSCAVLLTNFFTFFITLIKNTCHFSFKMIEFVNDGIVTKCCKSISFDFKSIETRSWVCVAFSMKRKFFLCRFCSFTQWIINEDTKSHSFWKFMSSLIGNRVVLNQTYVFFSSVSSHFCGNAPCCLFPARHIVETFCDCTKAKHRNENNQHIYTLINFNLFFLSWKIYFNQK